MDESARELTGAIASGDPEAFSCFYRAWFDRMYAEARRATGRGEDFCLDVVQEAMMRVIRSMKPLDGGEAALARWVRLTVRSCAYDRLRRDARRSRREEAASRTASAPETEGERRAEELTERLAWLRREIADLEEPARALLLLRHRFGLTLAQVGAAVGLGTGAVDGRITREIARLQRRAQETFDD